MKLLPSYGSENSVLVLLRKNVSVGNRTKIWYLSLVFSCHVLLSRCSVMYDLEDTNVIFCGSNKDTERVKERARVPSILPLSWPGRTSSQTRSWEDWIDAKVKPYMDPEHPTKHHENNTLREDWFQWSQGRYRHCSNVEEVLSRNAADLGCWYAFLGVLLRWSEEGCECCSETQIRKWQGDEEQQQIAEAHECLWLKVAKYEKSYVWGWVPRHQRWTS